MFKTAITVSQNSKVCSEKQGTDRPFPLVNAMKERDYIMCYMSLKSNWTKHRKAFIFSRKKLSKNGAQKISSVCPFNMSEAGMCILKKN